jgi:hypothetical protein
MHDPEACVSDALRSRGLPGRRSSCSRSRSISLRFQSPQALPSRLLRFSSTSFRLRSSMNMKNSCDCTISSSSGRTSSG